MHSEHAPSSQSLAIDHPIMLSHGRNAEVWDDTGKRYIDFVGGIGVLNLGHCHPRIVEAVREQAGRLTHSAFNAVPHQGYGQFMQALARFVPVSYPLCGMVTNSCAEATENALKIVRAATGRCLRTTSRTASARRKGARIWRSPTTRSNWSSSTTGRAMCARWKTASSAP